MDSTRHRDTLRLCDYYRRGILGADEVCRKILCFCVEPPFIAEYMGLLPDDLRSALAGHLPTLPTSDEEWTNYRGLAQLDGDDHSWAEMIAECRAGTEACRRHLFGVTVPKPAPDFMDRVRSAYRDRMRDFSRTVEEERERRLASDLGRPQAAE